MEKLTALSERLRLGGAEVGRKVSERMGTVSDRVRDMFQPSNAAVDRLVEEATGLHGFDPDWAQLMDICDMINGDKISGQDMARSIKRRFAGYKEPRGVALLLLLLEAVVKNCDRMFAEVASEKILDEMVKQVVDDPHSSPENRDKALKLIESWGEATDELRYLPVFEETYKSLKSRGVRFPGRDAESLAPIFTPPQSVETAPVRSGISRLTLRDVVAGQPPADNGDHEKEALDVARNSVELLSTVLTSSPQQEVLKEELTIALVEQCRQSQFNVQRIIERVGENEALLFEALNINDELQKALDKYEEFSTAGQPPPSAPAPGALELPKSDESAFVIVDEDPELDESLVRNKASKASATGARSSRSEDPLADLDKMIFGGKPEEESSSDKLKKKSGDDMISF